MSYHSINTLAVPLPLKAVTHIKGEFFLRSFESAFAGVGVLARDEDTIRQNMVFVRGAGSAARAPGPRR
jgi:hypothetical protein